jgi:hypothetical protein
MRKEVSLCDPHSQNQLTKKLKLKIKIKFPSLFKLLQIQASNMFAQRGGIAK